MSTDATDQQTTQADPSASSTSTGSTAASTSGNITTGGTGIVSSSGAVGSNPYPNSVVQQIRQYLAGGIQSMGYTYIIGQHGITILGEDAEEEEELQVTYKQFSINSKKLGDRVIDTVKSSLDFMTKITKYTYNCDTFEEYMQDVISELIGEGLITHGRIVLNSTGSNEAETYPAFTVSFKQYNCLNTSRIEFQVIPTPSE